MGRRFDGLDVPGTLEPFGPCDAVELLDPSNLATFPA